MPVAKGSKRNKHAEASTLVAEGSKRRKRARFDDPEASHVDTKKCSMPGCSARMPANDSHVTCEQCRIIGNEYMRAYREQRREDPTVCNGCGVLKDPVLDSGKETCASCRKKSSTVNQGRRDRKKAERELNKRTMGEKAKRMDLHSSK
jgi:hypothetical protein